MTGARMAHRLPQRVHEIDRVAAKPRAGVPSIPRPRGAKTALSGSSPANVIERSPEENTSKSTLCHDIG